MRSSREHWLRLWADLGAAGAGELWHSRLIGAYAEPQRRYHNGDHLKSCLKEFDRVRLSLRQPALVECALWFHDVVYDPRSTDNEIRSAELAHRCLQSGGVPSRQREVVARLIRCTINHEVDENPDSAWLLDVDLAVLGGSDEQYERYERAIRAEYAWVPWSVFAAKRAAILAGLLHRIVIYRTESFRERFEARARANLAAAIRQLAPTSS